MKTPIFALAAILAFTGCATKTHTAVVTKPPATTTTTAVTEETTTDGNLYHVATEEHSAEEQNSLSSTNGRPQVYDTAKMKASDLYVPPKKDDIPPGIKLPGREGFVKSPYTDQGVVDVQGYPPGTQVRDPFTGKLFIVP